MVKVRKSFILTVVAAALLIPLIFVALASAQSTTSHQVAGDYTIELPVLSGPPVTVDGVTTIAGTVDVETRGSQIGSSPVTFTCVLGAGGAPNVCGGTFVFDGILRGRIGTYKAIMDEWTSGGDEKFASVHFKLVPGSGTGDLSNLVEAEGFIQRDEAVEVRVGVYWGTVRFEGDETPSTSIQLAGDYTVFGPPTLSGPPVTEDGVTTIAGTVNVDTRGSQIGSSPVDFTCVLGADGAPNVCDGSFLFTGSVLGRIGTYEAIIDNWTAGGDAAYTSAHFKLVGGSGTGDLSNMVELEGSLNRDETADPPVGVYVATVRFEGDSTPTQVEEAPKELSDYSISELFALEAAGDITEDELAAELERRK